MYVRPFVCKNLFIVTSWVYDSCMVKSQWETTVLYLRCVEMCITTAKEGHLIELLCLTKESRCCCYLQEN